jgi:alpha-beta hydrolase superfamily lysophospholipase
MHVLISPGNSPAVRSSAIRLSAVSLFRARRQPTQFAATRERTSFSSPASTHAPALRFGAQNPTGYSALYQTIKPAVDAIRKGFRKIIRGFDYCQANIQLGLMATLCLLSFMPMPDFSRRYLQRHAFFGPIHLCDTNLLKDPSLEPKIADHKFNMNRYRGTLEQAGFQFKPSEDAIRIHGWQIPAQGGKPTVVFSHGRGVNISYLSKVMRVLSDEGYGVFVYDYPGFGQSGGQPNEEGCYKAGLAVSRYLAEQLKIPTDQQVLMGYSMGSAVATDVAEKLTKLNSPPKALVLVNTFPSLRTTFNYRLTKDYPWAKRLLSAYKIKLDFNSSDKLKTLSQLPILILQGEKDTDTPMPLIRQTMVDAPGLDRHHITLEPLEGAKHRLYDKDYKTVGRHFFDYMDRAFPDRE